MHLGEDRLELDSVEYPSRVPKLAKIISILLGLLLFICAASRSPRVQFLFKLWTKLFSFVNDKQ